MPELELMYTKPGKRSKIQAQMGKITSNEVQFGCIQSLDLMEPDLQQSIHRMLEKKFPAQDIPSVKADIKIRQTA